MYLKMYEWMDGWMGWMDGMDGWMHGWDGMGWNEMEQMDGMGWIDGMGWMDGMDMDEQQFMKWGYQRGCQNFQSN